MRQTACICGGVILLAVAGASRGQGADEKERAAVKEMLGTLYKQVEPKVKDDEEALAALKKLRDANDEELDRMAREIKASFKVDRLDRDSIKKIEAQIEKAIKDADAEELAALRKALINRDSKSLPKRISPQLCWLFGCR